MKGFQPVTLHWGDKSYTVQAEDQLRLIAEIEDVLSDSSGRAAVSVLMKKGGPSFSRLSMAYAAALRYAGASVSDQEIYLTMQEGLADADSSTAEMVQDLVIGLLAIIAPPVHRRIVGDDTPGKPEPETTKPAAAS